MRLCGIDEAGRGPLAGPLVMAGVVLPRPIEGLADSKKLTPARRETLYETIRNEAQWHVVFLEAARIDAEGLAACLAEGLKEIMQHLDADEYLFDGRSTHGISGLRCQVKADRDVPEVSAASILAKVARDRYMVEMGRRYPAYGFENHKGYGTTDHIAAIREHGYSPIHRRSFRVKALHEPPLFE